MESLDRLSGHFVDIFNAILNSGYFPNQWSEGIIVPLFKKSAPCYESNYRGITLFSCFSKVFTDILNNRVTKWAENNNILSGSQFWFPKRQINKVCEPIIEPAHEIMVLIIGDQRRLRRMKYGTTDAIFVLNANIQKILNDEGRLFCAFIDLKMAFDSVYLNELWFKLHKIDINAKMLRIINDMYNKVISWVRGCNSYSDFFDCAVGLKQGEIISPMLFSLFIDDLELFLQDDQSIDDITFILMLFADDMVILG